MFHIGVNHLNGVTALEYARQPSLSEEGRVLRQQSLMRAVIHKLYSSTCSPTRSPCTGCCTR